MTPPSPTLSREGPERSPRPSKWILLAALVVTLFAVSHAWVKGPYSQHVDEHFLLGASHKILQSGNFDPGWYRYGSVSIHLCAIGEAVGYLDHSRKNRWKPVSELPQSIVPLARPAQLVSWPRLIFALLGGVSLLLAGLCANRLRPRSCAGPVTILLLASHLSVQEQWFGYLNVDVIAAFFAMSAIWAHLSARRDASWVWTSALPAALWGMAAATKYPMGIGVLSVVVADLLRRGRPSFWQALASLTVALLAFVALMPFALTNSPAFLSDLAYELSHYAKGHRDFTSEPGFDSAWHHVRAWLLPLGSAVAATLWGAVVAFKRTPRRAFTLLGPGFALLALLSLQSANFTRNSLLLGYLFCILAGVGVAAAFPWLLKIVLKLKLPGLRRPIVRRLSVALVLFGILLSTQWPAYAQLVGGHKESRDRLQLRLKKLPKDSRVAIPHPDFMSTDSVTLVNYDPLASSTEALLQLDRSQATHAIVPQKWARSRFRADKSVLKAVENAQTLTIPGKSIWRGGVDEVWVHWPFHPRGNPQVQLIEIERAQLRNQLAGAPN